MSEALDIVWFALFEECSPLAWACVLIVSSALALPMATALRRRRALDKVLLAPETDRPYLVRSLAANDRRRKWLTKKLFRILDAGLQPRLRRAALACLLALEEDEGGGASAANLCAKALADASSDVREAAIDHLRKRADEASIDLLRRHSSGESNADLARKIGVAIGVYEKRALPGLLEEENFDQAEAICRRILAGWPAHPELPTLLERIRELRRAKASRLQQAQRDKTQAKVRLLLDAAGKRLAGNQCPEAESLLRQALELDPANAGALRISDGAPALRRALDASLKSQNHSSHLRLIETRRQAATQALSWARNRDFKPPGI